MLHESIATVSVRVLDSPQVRDLLLGMTTVVAAAEAVLAQQHPECYSQEEVELAEAVVGFRQAVARTLSQHEPLPEWLTHKLPGVRP